MYILVVGSNSFSGSNYVDFLLSKKHKVIGISRSNKFSKVFLKYKNNENIKNFKFFSLDLNKNFKKFEKIINKFKPKYVVNFASQGMVAESWERPEDWYMTNTVSTIKVHNFLRKKIFLKKYVHISTPEVYGSTKYNQKEKNDFNPTTPYALSRATADTSLKSFGENYKFPYVITRAANVFGPCQQLYRIIPITILNAVENKKINLHGGGLSKRSFIHIKDVCDATYKVMLFGKLFSTYHISTKKIISIKDLVIKILDKLKKPKKLIKITKDRLGKDYVYYLNSDKIRKLGWKESVSLDQGLDETIGWVIKNYTLLKKFKRFYVHKK